MWYFRRTVREAASPARCGRPGGASAELRAESPLRLLLLSAGAAGRALVRPLDSPRHKHSRHTRNGQRSPKTTTDISYDLKTTITINTYDESAGRDATGGRGRRRVSGALAGRGGRRWAGSIGVGGAGAGRCAATALVARPRSACVVSGPEARGRGTPARLEYGAGVARSECGEEVRGLIT
ncbi:hypothetical protein EVAR_34210_1 [Eumeta japonica]|uniref:Uncharacterized protein n=1 Tax=Eumeta variegata TaxID=151549 RepID=A0A4C1WJP6_EUMVA|nr:hypothetical protein EVAR_34210_1 [Eumeta japonica]